MRHAVCHVIKPRGVHFGKVLKRIGAQNFRVQAGYAVHLMGADHGKVGHAHLPVADNAHLRNASPIAGEGLPGLAAEALIDLLDNSINTRQAETEMLCLDLLDL